VTAEYAIKHNDGVNAYNVAKVEGERAAWFSMEHEKPSFDLMITNPDVIIGPMLQPVHKP